MHTQSLARWTHDHVFLGEQHGSNERKTWFVVALTLFMMVAEIGGGHLFGSMALVADGWHMSTHAAALGIAALAYRFARVHAYNPRFSFGTGKIGELAGFTSAILLLGIAGYIVYDCAIQLLHPQHIRYGEAIAVAVAGLLTNIASAWLLHDDHEGDHDTNRRAAFVHVLADTFTSVLAILALLAGYLWGWSWLDPISGLIGAVVIGAWAVGLIRTAGLVLLDAVPSGELIGQIRSALEQGTDLVSDLHLWRVGPGHHAVVVTVVTDYPEEPAFYKARLAGLTGLSHITVEVERCPEPPLT